MPHTELKENTEFTPHIICSECGNTKNFVYFIVGECRYKADLTIEFNENGEEICREEDNHEYDNHDYTRKGLDRCGECCSNEVYEFETEKEMKQWLEDNPEVLKNLTAKKV